MIISPKREIIYLASGRTGSTFIHHAAQDVMNDGEIILVGVHDIDGKKYGMKHANLSLATQYLGMPIDTFKVFLFVRNPIDKLKSSFGLLLNMANEGIDTINKIENPRWRRRCLEFYKNQPDINKYIVDRIDMKAMIRSQGTLTGLIDIPHNDVEYLKYEDFDASCSRLFRAFGYPPPDTALKINSSPDHDFELRSATIEKIRLFFRDDMNRFSYV